MELQIKRILQEQGHNNIWLAEQLNTSPQYVGQVAKGTAGATMAQYERIAEVLNVKLWQLFAPQEDYILREEHNRMMTEAEKQRELRDRPDLILIDRETGRSQNYVLQKED